MMENRYWMLVVACAVLAAGAAVLRVPDVDIVLREALPAQARDVGFATSITCQQCHPGPYDSWHQSYHRTMTQAAGPASVLGAFDDIILEDRGYRYRLERQGTEFWVELPDPLWFETRYNLLRFGIEPPQPLPETPPVIRSRVVLTTGSHHMQNYWIRRTGGDGEYPAADDGSLIQFPWIWLVQERRWVPNQDSFLSPPTDFIGGPSRWNVECSQCHSVATEPGTSESYEGFDTRTVELGIACEACHGPAEEHVRTYQSPVQRYVRYFRGLRGQGGVDPTIVNPERLQAERSVESCAYCHSYGEWRDAEAFLREGVPFRPGDELSHFRSVFRYTQNPDDPLLRNLLETDPLTLRGAFWPDGTIRVAGREYNGLLESPCFTTGKLTCLTCHSMHSYEAPASQLDPRGTGKQSCVGCHVEYSGDTSSHTRHLPESTGSECMNCHMPHTTYGLFTAMRSHRIDSPSVEVSVNSGRPNGCNLCHLDQTLEWTGKYLSEWYGQPPVELDEDERSIAAAILWVMRGDAAQRTILAWHMGWDAAQEASGNTWLAPYLAQLLVDSYAATRQVAYRSIVSLPGFEGFRYDYIASGTDREQKSIEAMERWLRAGGAFRASAELLIGEGSTVYVDVWRRLLSERDERPLAIIE